MMLWLHMVFCRSVMVVCTHIHMYVYACMQLQGEFSIQKLCKHRAIYSHASMIIAQLRIVLTIYYVIGGIV